MLQAGNPGCRRGASATPSEALPSHKHHWHGVLQVPHPVLARNGHQRLTAACATMLLPLYLSGILNLFMATGNSPGLGTPGGDRDLVQIGFEARALSDAT